MHFNKLSKKDKKCFDSIARYWGMTVYQLRNLIRERSIQCVEKNFNTNVSPDFLLGYVGDYAVNGEIYYLVRACEYDANLTPCGHCGKINLQFDDCGYFGGNNKNGVYCAGCNDCVHPSPWSER
jgi:hypothetical protein